MASLALAALVFCGAQWWLCCSGLADKAFRVTGVEDFYKGVGRNVLCRRTSCKHISKLCLKSNVYSFCRTFFFTFVFLNHSSVLSSASDISVVSEFPLATHKVLFFLFFLLQYSDCYFDLVGLATKH